MKVGFKRRRKIELDTHGKIEAAQNKVNEAFIMFQQAHDSLEEANKELKATVEQSDSKVISLNAQLSTEQAARQKALDQHEANEKLKEQLKPFLA